VSRLAFFFSAAFLLAAVAFLLGLYSGATKSQPYSLIYRIVTDFKSVLSERDEILGTRPVHWTSPRRYEGSGVTMNQIPSGEREFIFLQGLFDNQLQLRLIRRNGEIINSWALEPRSLTNAVTHIRNPPPRDWGFDSHGAAVLEDGSVIFNLDHVGLVKLDRCGKRQWLVEAPTHHSIEINDDGSMWVPSAINHYDQGKLSLGLFKPPFAEDTLIKVSSDGKVLESLSLLDVFVSEGAMGLLTLTGGIAPSTMSAFRPDASQELFHLNDAEELPASLADSFPQFQEGDLLLSLRNRNLVMVLDAQTREIKWWMIGNWVRQHDPDWIDGRIRVFDNNRDGTNEGAILGSSKIVEVDPTTNETRVVYGEKPSQFFYTERRGKHQNLPDGRVLITEAEAGRVFEVDAKGGIVWEYVNRFDETYSARISQAIAYPESYFTVADWSCS
jgi:hypothetical protein